MHLNKKIPLALLLAMLACLLCGCGDVELGGGKFDPNTSELVCVIQAEELAKLDEFTALEAVDFSGSLCYEEIAQWAAAHPDVAVKYTLELSDSLSVDNSATALELSALDAAQLADALPLLKYLPELERLELGDGKRLGASSVAALISAYPQLELSCELSLAGGSYTLEETELDLSELSSADVAEASAWLSCMRALEYVDLGNDAQPDRLSWEDILSLQTAAPGADFDYSFSLYGRALNLSDSAINLSHVRIDDEGALVKQVTACMKNLSSLDMDSCGVSNESMAELRDSLPNANVVWRVWFGDRYSVRTDVEKILASNPGLGGQISSASDDGLYYCTKVKYLDLGHNDDLDDLSFVSNMPDLEVAILAMGIWSDARPLADCPKLEYLELQTSALADLRPLSGLKNLKHLNICYSFSLTDISPLYELTQLERLWIGCLSPVPREQVDKMQALAPNCVINTTAFDPTSEGWRYFGTDEYGVSIVDPRYALLRNQFEYARSDAYAYQWNDPLY